MTAPFLFRFGMLRTFKHKTRGHRPRPQSSGALCALWLAKYVVAGITEEPSVAVGHKTLTASIAEFIVSARPPAAARERAAVAACDTVGVILAGAPEPA